MKKSHTHRDRIRAMSDEDIDTSEIPEITQEQMKKAVLRFGGQPVSEGKIQVKISLDAEVVAYFESRAGGRDYRELVNEALRAIVRDSNG